jgi:hypothetical protein
MVDKERLWMHNKNMATKERTMKRLALNTLEFTWKAFWSILILPFIAVAFGITKLLGGEPLSMDDMGAGFMTMCAIAVGLGVAAVSFGIGYLI